MKIFIIILHYGKLETTQKCIASLAKHDREFEKIVLINNNAEIEVKQSEFSFSKNKIHIVNNKKNIGFAAGVNIGITYALKEHADYIFLLNNDTIIGKDFLQKLKTVLEENNQIGIVGPVIEFKRDEKTIYDLGGKVNVLIGRTSHEEVGAIPRNRPKLNLHIVTYISGCCMLIRREVFKNIGLFDEKFFLYYEDVDFCLRAKKAGFLSAVMHDIVIYHELSKAAGNISAFSVYHQTKSGVTFGKKYCRIPLLNLGFLFGQSCLFLIKNGKAGIGAFTGLWNGLHV